MSIVPGWSLKFSCSVNAILSTANGESLAVLDPGLGVYIDKTYVTWFRFLHDLLQAIPEILRKGWVHEWPTYCFIPAHFKEPWFLILAVSTDYL